jgi:replicative DNA helicase
MNGDSCVERMLFMESQADLQRWRTGYGRVNANNEFERLTAAAERIGTAQLLIDDTGSLTCEELIARVKRVHRQKGIGLVVLDYIQLLRSGRRSQRPDRVQELSEISGEIRRCANRLKLPWLVLAQMNREIEREVNRAPRLSDLKDSGALEQDADTVTFLYRPQINSESKQQEVEETIQRWCQDQEQVSGGVVWAKPEYCALLLAKNRYGPVGRAEVLFVKSCTYFADYQLERARLGLKKSGGKRAPVTEPLILEEHG